MDFSEFSLSVLLQLNIVLFFKENKKKNFEIYWNEKDK